MVLSRGSGNEKTKRYESIYSFDLHRKCRVRMAFNTAQSVSIVHVGEHVCMFKYTIKLAPAKFELGVVPCPARVRGHLNQLWGSKSPP